MAALEIQSIRSGLVCLSNENSPGSNEVRCATKLHFSENGRVSFSEWYGFVTQSLKFLNLNHFPRIWRMNDSNRSPGFVLRKLLYSVLLVFFLFNFSSFSQHLRFSGRLKWC